MGMTPAWQGAGAVLKPIRQVEHSSTFKLELGWTAVLKMEKTTQKRRASDKRRQRSSQVWFVISQRTARGGLTRATNPGAPNRACPAREKLQVAELPTCCNHLGLALRILRQHQAGAVAQAQAASDVECLQMGRRIAMNVGWQRNTMWVASSSQAHGCAMQSELAMHASSRAGHSSHQGTFLSCFP